MLWNYYILKTQKESNHIMAVCENLLVSPLKSYKLDNYNSTKDSLPNTETHLRDTHIETSDGGHIRANG